MECGDKNIEKKKICPECWFVFKESFDCLAIAQPKCPKCEEEAKLLFGSDPDQSVQPEDEELAKRICCLQDQESYEEIRRIGEYLCENGGSPRMARVGYRVHALGGSLRELEFEWEGICKWIA
jgi:hypothetical protein